MIEDLRPSDHHCAPAENPAIARCCQAFDRAFRATLERTKSRACANLDGNEAYRKAMPALIAPGSIRDFIACVTHGMVIGAIGDAQGARLLYAAHIAHSTAPKPPAIPKLPAA